MNIGADAFAWTLSLGSLIQVAAMFCSAAIFLIGMRFMARSIVDRLLKLEVIADRTVENVHDISVTMAKMESYDRRITRLEDKTG